MRNQEKSSTHIIEAKKYEDYKLFIPYGEKLSVKKGYELYSDHENFNKLFYLEKGEFKLIERNKSGKERLIFCIKGPNLIGEMGFLNTPIDDFCLIAKEESFLYGITRETIEKEILPYKPFLTNLFFLSIAEKASLFLKQNVLLSTHDIQVLICRILNQHLIHANGSVYAKTELRQDELADLMGIHRVTVSKNIQVLKKRGVIGGYKKNRVEILDMQAFNALISEDI